MKSRSLVFVLCMIAFATQAQKSAGIRLGRLSSSLYLSPSEDQESVIGSTFGLSYVHLENQKAGILLELTFLNKGWNISKNDSTYKRNQDYANLTFFTRFTLGKNRSKVLIDLGTEIGYVLNATESSTGGKEEFDRTVQFADVWERWSFSLGLALGYQFPIGERYELEINGRFVQTLTQVYPIDEYLYSLPQHLMLSTALRYRFTN